jgi:HSP20 family protein
MAQSMVPANRPPAPVGRWDPWREFEELQSRFDQLFGGIFGQLAGGFGTAGWRPLADVTETDDAYLVEVDVPGMKAEDIRIETAGTDLTVSGETTQKEREGLLRSRTRQVGRFEYRTTLPANADIDKISAELADGVLTVRVPKSETAKPRRIEITSK